MIFIWKLGSGCPSAVILNWLFSGLDFLSWRLDLTLPLSGIRQELLGRFGGVGLQLHIRQFGMIIGGVLASGLLLNLSKVGRALPWDIGVFGVIVNVIRPSCESITSVIWIGITDIGSRTSS